MRLFHSLSNWIEINGFGIFIVLTTLLAFSWVLFLPVSAQPGYSVYCDVDTVYIDLSGKGSIKCYIDNPSGYSVNEKVGTIFDDWNGEEIQILDVRVDGESIKNNLEKSKPEGYKRTKQLSNQNIQTQSGEIKDLIIDFKAPFGSFGKFDVIYGEFILDPHWLSSWEYKLTVNLTSNRTLINYPVNITLATDTLILAGKMKSDCSDIRVTDSDDTDNDYDYFIRNCDSHNSEIWFLDNFTQDETNSYGLFYGNVSASNVMVDPYTIVWAWNDFENANSLTGYNWDWSDWANNWDNRTICQGGSFQNRDHLQVINGVLAINNTLGPGCDTTDNKGTWFWLNGSEFNFSEYGYLVDVLSYRNGGSSGYKSIGSVRNEEETTLDLNYGTAQRNVTEIYSNFLINIDYVLVARGDNAVVTYWFKRNESDYYTSSQKWERTIVYYDHENGYFNVTGNYTGQPYTDYIGMVCSSGTCVSPYSYWDLYTDFNATIELGGSIGGGFSCNNCQYIKYEHIFIRKYVSGEPYVSYISSEEPFNGANLDIYFIDPTPPDTTTTSDSNITIKIESNKTLHHCILNWDSVNESMNLINNTQCEITKNITTIHTYKVYAHDLWDFWNETETRTVTYSVPENITTELSCPAEIIAMCEPFDTWTSAICLDNNTLKKQKDCLIEWEDNTTQYICNWVKTENTYCENGCYDNVTVIGSGCSPTDLELLGMTAGIFVAFIIGSMFVMAGKKRRRRY